MTGDASDARDAQRDAMERMPIVTDLVARLKRDGFRFAANVLLFGTQHLMAQSLALCGALEALGLDCDRMHLAGKAYSTHPGTLSRLEALGIRVQMPRRYDLTVSQTAEQVRDLQALAMQVSQRKMGLSNPLVLVLDDGGHALAGVRSWLRQPITLAGVEQTASGFRQPGMGVLDFPTVDVGASAVKRRCEPRIVIEAALERAHGILLQDGTRSVGIVGLGSIGLALYRMLTARGFTPTLFDERTNAYPDVATGQRARRVHEVIDTCDVIFGCTGSDITRDLATETAQRGLSRRGRRLVSLSSGDDEFFTLKSAILAEQRGTYAIGNIPDIEGEFQGSPFVIHRNGFPINFDNTPESAPLEQIQGTIAALVAAVCQASTLPCGAPFHERVTLDLAFQGWLYDRWIHYLPALPNGIKAISRTRAESLSQPRAEPRSVVLDSPFGSWVDERTPTPEMRD